MRARPGGGVAGLFFCPHESKTGKDTIINNFTEDVIFII
jgi:hypothetical protein